MPLVEIIKGKETSDEALAKAYDVVQQIRKTPIVVNDSRGFYTSRVIGYMVNEGMAMLAEGVQPWSIERATTQAGYPAPVLQLSDELNLELMAKIAKATKEAAERDGTAYAGHPGTAVVDKMLEAGRAGRLRKARASTTTTRPASAARSGPVSPSCSRSRPSSCRSRT